MAQEHVWVDSDPMKFADDNIAVVMLVRSPEKVRIDAISTVSGNSWSKDGADGIQDTLKVLGAHIPVHLGAQDPLVHTVDMSKREGPLEFAGAFAMPHPPVDPHGETAVPSLIQAIEHSKDGLTIVAIGPLTNIAEVLKRRPDLAPRIKRLIIMGGNVRVPGNANKTAEFNFWFDPEAASIVMKSAIPKKIMFGLDICNKAILTKSVFDRIVAVHTPITALYRDALGNSFPGFLKNPKATSYLWDELVAAYLIDPGFVTKSENLYLDVVTEFGPKYGATVEMASPKSRSTTPVQVMFDLDLNRVLALYERLLKL
ncbi:MAG TPA: nucleoside hydrolase [Bryobacteraceae bacterium]|jgi:inosine-uridine nucleoside N-ribohydrolase